MKLAHGSLTGSVGFLSSQFQTVKQDDRKRGSWYALELFGEGFQMVPGISTALKCFGEGLITASEFVTVAKEAGVRYDMALAILVFEFPNLDWAFLDKPALIVH